MNVHLPQNELTRAEAAELSKFFIRKQVFSIHFIFFPKTLFFLSKIISTILLYIQPAKEASLNLDSKSKLSMKVRISHKKPKNKTTSRIFIFIVMAINTKCNKC